MRPLHMTSPSLPCTSPSLLILFLSSLFSLPVPLSLYLATLTEGYIVCCRDVDEPTLPQDMYATSLPLSSYLSHSLYPLPLLSLSSSSCSPLYPLYLATLMGNIVWYRDVDEATSLPLSLSPSLSLFLSFSP